MTADRDQHGMTRKQIADALAEPTDEPRELLDPPSEPDTTEDQPS